MTTTFGRWHFEQWEEEAQMNADDRNPFNRLVYEIGQAAQAGWARTARMMALLAVAAAAVALVLATSR